MNAKRRERRAGTNIGFEHKRGNWPPICGRKWYCDWPRSFESCYIGLRKRIYGATGDDVTFRSSVA